VGKWRSRFVAKRLDGLLDEPRPGAPRTVSDAAVERVVTLTMETTPRDATHWSTRAMARQCGLSQSTVSRIWRAFSLQPHGLDDADGSRPAAPQTGQRDPQQPVGRPQARARRGALEDGQLVAMRGSRTPRSAGSGHHGGGRGG
jgi:hypothetical protein